MLLRRSLFLMATLAVLMPTLGCGGGGGGVASAPDEPEPEMTEEDEAAEEAYNKSIQSQ